MVEQFYLCVCTCVCMCDVHTYMYVCTYVKIILHIYCYMCGICNVYLWHVAQLVNLQ